MSILARELMQTDAVTISPDTPFLQIQHLFVVAGIGSAPVVDDRGTVLGVISSSDLLRAVDQACDDEIDPGPSDGGAAGCTELPERLGALKALDVATRDPIWVSPDTPASRVADIMRTAGIHHVLVGDGQRLAGVLTTFDLLRAVAP